MANANDSNLKVNVTAAIEGLTTGFANAEHTIKKFTQDVQGHMQTLTGVFEQVGKSFEALAAVFVGGKVFKDAIESTEKLVDESRQLAQVFGITTEAASGINQALQEAGVSTDQYIDAAQKLDRQVRTNEQNINKLGLQTRDSSGAFREQNDLVRSAVQLLQSYKEGTDRNLAAQVLFGRGVGDVGKLMRVTNEAMEQGAIDAKDLGLVVGEEDVEAWHKFHVAMQEAHDVIQGLWRVVADGLQPVLIELAGFFRDIGPGAIFIFKGAMEALQLVLLGIIVPIRLVFEALQTGLALTIVAFVTFGTVASKALQLDYEGAKKAAEDGTRDIEKILKSSGDRIAKIWAPLGQSLASIGIGSDKKGESSQKGTKEFPENLTAGADKRAKEQDKLAVLAVERDKMIAEEAIKAEEQKNKELLDLDQISNTEYLKRKLDLQQRLDSIDIKAAEDKRDAIQNDIVAREKASNEIIALAQKQAAEEEQIRHQLVIEQQKEQQKLAESINSSLLGGLTDFISGTKSAKDAFKDFVLSMDKELSAFVSKQLLKQIFGEGTGASGNGGGFGALISSYFGSGGGGGGFGSSGGAGGAGLYSSISGVFAGFLASGGPAMAGNGYVVGENGPEFFLPKVNGTVLNQSQMSNMGSSTVINMNVSTPDANSFRKNQGQMLADMQAALARSVRRNG